ncbi:hypothetical protein HYFRA_00012779 [Hymenoscyphus fraxineus]|uniref:Uncharacterized protein n=1 Tax=Hymenoscyphus fraxineus TaxID=746836 RepID=A0A9N9PN10_9HELO|nr:hypothetical protein HYFRA_00012779 [Hymenoscyphus fraxineus]
MIPESLEELRPGSLPRLPPAIPPARVLPSEEVRLFAQEEKRKKVKKAALPPPEPFNVFIFFHRALLNTSRGPNPKLRCDSDFMSLSNAGSIPSGRLQRYLSNADLAQL